MPLRSVYQRLMSSLQWRMERSNESVEHLVNRRADLLREHVDLRFDDSNERRQRAHHESVARIEQRVEDTSLSVTESLNYVGTQLSELMADAQRDLLEVRRIEDLSLPAADFFNFGNSHRGFPAQAHLWFNPPVVVELAEGAARIEEVTERIAELPYAFRALGPVAPPARILDVGSTESTVPISLASLGYRVTALDFRPYPLEHPGVEAVRSALEDYDPVEPFEAITCISTLEHFGIGDYDEARRDPEADVKGLRRMRELLVAGGRLVLTVPYGQAAGAEGARVYDAERLGRALEGWDVLDRTVLARESQTVWRAGEGVDDGGEAVALVTATPAG